MIPVNFCVKWMVNKFKLGLDRRLQEALSTLAPNVGPLTYGNWNLSINIDAPAYFHSSRSWKERFVASPQHQAVAYNGIYFLQFWNSPWFQAMAYMNIISTVCRTAPDFRLWYTMIATVPLQYAGHHGSSLKQCIPTPHSQCARWSTSVLYHT